MTTLKPMPTKGQRRCYDETNVDVNDNDDHDDDDDDSNAATNKTDAKADNRPAANADTDAKHDDDAHSVD